MSRAMGRCGMNARMSDLVGDELHGLCRISSVRAADGPALFVEEGQSALERRIARREPHQLELQLADGRVDHRPRAGRVCTYGDELRVEPGSGFANGVEAIHLMFLVRDAGESVVALASARSCGRLPQTSAS